MGGPLVTALKAVSPAVRSLVSKVSSNPARSLAFTGSGILVLAIAGVGFLLAGGGLRQAARTRAERRYDHAAAS
jgi:hypothetical protein